MSKEKKNDKEIEKKDKEIEKNEKEDFDATKVIPSLKDIKNIKDTTPEDDENTEKVEKETTKVSEKTEVIPTITTEDLKEAKAVEETTEVEEEKEEVPTITYADLTDDPPQEKESEKIVLERPDGKRKRKHAKKGHSFILIIVAILIVLLVVYAVSSLFGKDTSNEKDEVIESSIINDGKMTISDTDVLGEENMNQFFSKLKTTDEKISIVIETKSNDAITQTTTLSYTPGVTNVYELESTKVDLNEVYKEKIKAENLPAKKINLKKINITDIYNNKLMNNATANDNSVVEEDTSIQNVSNTNVNNAVVEFDAYGAITNEYGEYELRIKPADGEEVIYTFDALNWTIVKDVSEKNIKVSLKTDLNVKFQPVICEYTSKVSDITKALLEKDASYCGRIYSVDSDRIYFYSKNNDCYSIENTSSNSKIKFFNGRTYQTIKLSQIKENDYVRTYPSGEVHIYRNLSESALKSEVLANISLAKEKATPDFMQVDVDAIEKSADKVAVVDIIVHDFVNPEFDTAAKEKTVSLKVKFDKKTLFFSDTGKINSVDSLIESVGDINSIILDKATINSSTPRVIEFNSKNVE